MIYHRMPRLLRPLPDAVQRYILHFESEIELALRDFAAALPPGSRVLDAGAGEAQYAALFQAHTYVALDLGIGDSGWSYEQLDVIATLDAIPFCSETFDACLNIVTLEHVRNPAAVVAEIARVLRPGGRLLLVTPMEWEEHQQPHDYYRYTRYGLEHLVSAAGLRLDRLTPAGGLFRLLGRRLLNAGQLAPWLMPFVALPALTAPLLDPLDRERNFTLGHICSAHKP